MNLNDLKWGIKSLWPWSSIRLFKRFLCNFYNDPSLNLTCQVWYKYKLHLVTLSKTPLSQGSTDRPGKPEYWKGPIETSEYPFWAIRLTKLLLGHCGSFKVIVMGQFVWIETKTRSISIDFVLTVSNSENQIFLYLLLSQSESIISLIDSSLNLWPWSSILAADLSLR